jgi:hypothetical protein
VGRGVVRTRRDARLRHVPEPRLCFSRLYDHLTAAGCRVGVELDDDGRHSIVVMGEGRAARADPACG